MWSFRKDCQAFVVVIALALVVILTLDAFYDPSDPDRATKLVLSQLYEAKPGDLLINKDCSGNPDWEHVAVVVQRPSRETICFFQPADPEAFPYAREVENIAPQVFDVVWQGDPSRYPANCVRVVRALVHHFGEMDLNYPGTFLPAEVSPSAP